MSEFMDFVRTSFLHVAPLLVAAAIAVAIIVERFRALFQVYPIKDMPMFFEKVRELIMAGKVSDALSLCESMPAKPAAKVVKAALLRAHQAETLIEHGLQIQVAEVTAAVQKRTSFLATIANVATLLGLFGTIAGLIHSFEAVGHADPQQKGALLAAGISQAMNATMLGLGVAIPCMIAFSILMNRSNRLIGEIESSAIQALDILKQRYYSLEAEVINETTQPQVRGNSELRRVS